jgi:hypothetical protein
MRVRVAIMTAAAALVCGSANAGVTVYTSASAFAAAVAIQHTATFESFPEARQSALTDDGINFTSAGAVDLYTTSAGEHLTQNTVTFPTRALSATGNEDFFIRLASGASFGAIGLDYATNRFGPPVLSLYGADNGLIGSFAIPQEPETLGFFGLISTTRIAYATSIVDRGIIEDTAIDNVRIGEGAGAAVPEPASWALMIAGFGLAGAALRRRRTALA